MDYYQILGISHSATANEIRDRYRLLALTLHPDKSSGTSEEFILVTEAYTTLRDPEKKRAYDASRFQLQVNEDVRQANTVTRNDLTPLGPGEFSYTCGRCEEGTYLVLEEDLATAEGCIVTCDVCSLGLLVVSDHQEKKEDNKASH